MNKICEIGFSVKKKNNTYVNLITYNINQSKETTCLRVSSEGGKVVSYYFLFNYNIGLLGVFKY